MLVGDYKPEKTFTVDEANRMLPLVRAITHDLYVLANDVIDRQQRLEILTGGRDRNTKAGGDPYSDELAQIERDLENDVAKLNEYLDELKALGVEPKGAAEGLIDFPAIIGGELVFLCWKLGESEVLHWHRLNDGFAGRQPLVAESVADG